MKKNKILLVVNPHAGMMRIRTILIDIIDLYCRQGKEVTVYTTKAKGDATQVVLRRSSAFEMVVCCGGDGTLNEVVAGMMPLEEKPLLGYLPAGSTNDFAASLQISTNLIEAAQRSLKGRPYELDIGLFNDRYFSYVASFGAFTESSYATPQHVKNALGHLAYVLEGVKDIANIRPIRLRVCTQEAQWEEDYLFGCVTNSTSIAGLLKLDAARVKMNDGKFEVLLVRNPQNAQETQKILSSIFSRQADNDVVKFFSTEEIAFYPQKIIPWSLDGEYEPGAKEIRIRNLRQALQINI